MCGIAGIIDIGFNADLTAVISRMVNAIAHRGPNASGSYVKGKVALGHARLSILDLSSSANQPFKSRDGRYVMIYNGEVYNYKQLRHELTDYNFETSGDTEVVLAAYLKWGTNFLEKLNGMFSIAIWDCQEETLLLARDRLGIKPLYYTRKEEGIVFASEIRALLSSGLVDKTLDTEGLSQYLMYQATHGKQTLIKDVYQLDAGSFALFQKGELNIQRYWSPYKNAGEQVVNKATAQKEIRNLLFDSVEHRMVSDVPLGAFLSGGIDSSAIVGIMSSISSKKVNTFSVTFEEKKYDESVYANLIAKKYNTEHHQVQLKANSLLDNLDNALSSMDNPSGDGINSYIISQETKKSGLTVALSGLGGDELFAGYPVFAYMHKLMNNHPIWKVPFFARSIAAQLLKLVKGGDVRTSRMVELLKLNGPSFTEAYPVIRKIFSEKEIESLVKNSLIKKDQKSLEVIDEIHSDYGTLTRVSWAEMLTYTQNVLLRDVDQMSMAHALEVRVPFFDHRLVEYVTSVSDEVKHPEYPKQLLVESIQDLLPEKIVHRQKKGFAFPWEEWMRGDLSEFCENQLEHIKHNPLFIEQEVSQLWKKFKSGDRSIVWTKVWLLVVLGYWIDKNLS